MLPNSGVGARLSGADPVEERNLRLHRNTEMLDRAMLIARSGSIAHSIEVIDGHKMKLDLVQQATGQVVVENSRTPARTPR